VLLPFQLKCYDVQMRNEEHFVRPYTVCVTKVLSGYHVMCCVLYASYKYGNREPNFICIFSLWKWGDAESLGMADLNVPIVRTSADRCACSICGTLGRGRAEMLGEKQAVTSSNTQLLPTVMGPNHVLRCNSSASESSSILDTGI
jgi:hypothetical protein